MKKRKKKDTLGITTPEPPELNTRVYEKAFRRKRLIPCKFCEKKQLACGGQAVVVRATSNGKAYLRSKCCGKLWSMDMPTA